MTDRILRPNAAGDDCTIPNEAGAACPNHYQNVDEETADDLTTSVFSHDTDYLSYFEDLYNFQDRGATPVGTPAISNVRVYARVILGDESPSNAFAGRLGLKTGGTEFWSANKIVGITWGNMWQDWAQNPDTVAAWTWAEIDALQAGIALRTARINPPNVYRSYCTQVWIVVTYGGVAPTVTTQAMTDVANNEATGNGNVTGLGTEPVTQHGHCWNKTGTPDTSDSKTENGAKGATGAFTSDLTNLAPDTTYYVRAYATNLTGTSYGNEVQFKTTGATAPGLYANFWVWVDWNDDGDFADDYETITADVLDIPSIVYGKDRELDAAVPASLQLMVDNFDHKYSPPNVNSVLNQGGRTLRAGHKVMAGLSFPWDEFVDGDGVNIVNHTVMYDSTYAWSEESGTFVIDTNQIKETGGSGGIAVLDFEEPNAHVQVTFKKGADNDCIIVFRYSDSNNYLYIKTTNTDLEVRKVDGGVDTLLDGETFAWAVGVTKTVKVVLHNEYIWVLVDLTQIVPATRRAAGALLSSTHNETETKHGIGGPAIHADARYDNFGGVYSLFYGTIDRIVPMPNKERQTAFIDASDDMKIMARTKLFRRTYALGGYPAGMKSYLEEIFNSLPSMPINGELLDWGENVNTNPYKSWWNISALEVSHGIEREEHGFVYQDQDGLWRFEDKSHRTDSPHDAAICTIYDTYAINKLAFSNLKWESGEQDVRNLVSVHVEMSKADPLNPQEVWRCQEADVVDGGIGSSLLEIAGSGEIVMYMESKDFDAVLSLVTPTQTPAVYKIEGTIVNGPFRLDEVVTGSVSGATGRVKEQGGGYILVGECSAAFNAADIWLGAISKATIAIGYKIDGTIANGPFLFGEGITTDVSADTGIVREIGQNYILVESASGPFNAGDTLTGGTSAATLNGTITITAVGSLTLMVDYMANAAANGGGADRTANLTVALAYPFYNSYGKGAKITLTNGHADPIFVTRLVVRGNGYNLQDRGSVFVEDSTSQAAYGEHSVNIDADLLTTLAEAKTLADDIEQAEDEPRGKIVIEMKKGTKENLIKILSLKLSDRITLNFSDMGLNEDFYINKIEYRLGEGGLVLGAALTLEEVS